MRLGTRLLVCLGLGLGLTACQPLYGGAPERLHNPEKKKRPPEPPGQEDKIIYIEDCTASFQDDPRKWHPQPALAHPLIDTADTALQSADKTAEPNAKVGLIREAIDKYPYSSDATLKLAVAYDKVLRKGCAIAMLKRLAALAANPKFANEANRQIDAVGDNGVWFKGYRKDAMQAVGR